MERLPPTSCSMDEAVEDANGGHERASFGGEASVRFNSCPKGDRSMVVAKGEQQVCGEGLLTRTSGSPDYWRG